VQLQSQSLVTVRASISHDSCPQEEDRWIPFASRDYGDLVVVYGLTGRVFTCKKDSPPLHLVAESVVEWLEAYAGSPS
jgi:hypothetical protein